jgi:chaperonin GroEL
MHATKAAVEEGIVPGGGVALLRAQAAVGKMKLDGDDQVGVDIVRRAMEEPIRQILVNAGAASPDLIIEQVRSEKTATRGFNALTMEHTDLVKAGVVDPTKVVRHALQNAASVSALLLTTEALISELPEEDEDHAHGGGMGDF